MAMHSHWKRACEVFIVALALLAAPLLADAQPPAKVARIGFLMGGSPSTSAPLIDALRQGLGQLGYVEGRNFTVEARYAEGRSEVLPVLARELVHLKPDAILVAAPQAVRAARQATDTIPIVMAMLADPQEAEFVASLARPGGNLTGVSALAEGYSAKWVELLKEAAPRASRVAVLSNPANPSHAGFRRETQAAAKLLKATLLFREVRDPNELEGAFAAMAKDRANALLVFPDAVAFVHRARILEFAAKHRLPAMYPYREFVEAGGLMAYGSSLGDLFQRAATYVDKILKGAKPGDLPVEQSARFELAINLKTAKALGITFPQSILIRADQVIQ
jgi:putative ABC transport system substrate-binding protein